MVYNIKIESHRKEISKSQYHKLKGILEKDVEIKAIPFKINGYWSGWRYFVRIDINIDKI